MYRHKEPVKRLGIVQSRAFWRDYSPPASRDIRRLQADFESEAETVEEFDTRLEMLEQGGVEDRHLVRALAKNDGVGDWGLTCDPEMVRRFRIWVIAQGLKLLRKFDDVCLLHWLLPEDDVEFGQLHNVDWARLDMRDRRRIERHLSPNALVFGGSEVQADYKQRKWLVHRHLFVANGSRDQIETFRDRYCRPDTGKRKLLVVDEEVSNLPRQLAYALKLNCFRKIPVKRGKRKPREKRLHLAEHNEFMRYLARHRPTEFLFVVNATRANGVHFQLSDRVTHGLSTPPTVQRSETTVLVPRNEEIGM